jgi:hypothetical protein
MNGHRKQLRERSDPQLLIPIETFQNAFQEWGARSIAQVAALSKTNGTAAERWLAILVPLFG